MPNTPPLDLGALPKLGPRDVRLLWVNDFYDAPLEAIVEHEGARCIMVLHDRSTVPPAAAVEALRWVIFRLSSEQLAEEQRWHDLFAEHVGEHWCFHREPHTHPAAATAKPTPERFYDAYKTRAPLVLEARDAIGWVDEVPQR